jgi:hypothetical protein
MSLDLEKEIERYKDMLWQAFKASGSFNSYDAWLMRLEQDSTKNERQLCGEERQKI